MPLCECGTIIDNEECQCSLCASDCIDVNGSGSALNPWEPEVVFDPDSDNLASCASDGFLVQLPSYVTDPPRCQAYNSTNTSLTNDVSTVLALDSERYDSGGMHDVTTLNSRVTIAIDGIYIITFLCSFAANAAGDRAALIRKNGNEFLGGDEKKPTSASFETGMQATAQELLYAGEYLECVAKQDSGGALNVLATRYSPILTAQFKRRPPRA